MNCEDCGHATYLHRANGPTQNIAVDSPVPCYATVEEITGNDRVRRWRYCGCTSVHPLRPGDGL